MEQNEIVAEVEAKHINVQEAGSLCCDTCGDIEETCAPLKLVHAFQELRSDNEKDRETVERLTTDLAEMRHCLSVAESHRSELIEDIGNFEDDNDRLIFLWRYIHDSLNSDDLERINALFEDRSLSCDCRESDCPHVQAFPSNIHDARTAIDEMIVKLDGEEHERENS